MKTTPLPVRRPTESSSTAVMFLIERVRVSTFARGPPLQAIVAAAVTTFAISLTNASEAIYAPLKGLCS